MCVLDAVVDSLFEVLLFHKQDRQHSMQTSGKHRVTAPLGLFKRARLLSNLKIQGGLEGLPNIAQNVLLCVLLSGFFFFLFDVNSTLSVGPVSRRWHNLGLGRCL